MADDGSAQSTTIWPMPKFNFQVKWGGEVISFKEVTGINAETTVIEYRAGDSKQASTVKMPGLVKYGDITMKKGVFKSDIKFWDWFSSTKSNVIKRIPVTISLLDEAGEPTKVWELTNAFPLKVEATDLNAEGNEAAIESIVISHEKLDEK